MSWTARDIDYCLDMVVEELGNGKLAVADPKSGLQAVYHFRRLLAVKRLERKYSPSRH